MDETLHVQTLPPGTFGVVHVPDDTAGRLPITGGLDPTGLREVPVHPPIKVQAGGAYVFAVGERLGVYESVDGQPTQLIKQYRRTRDGYQAVIDQ